MYRLLQLTRVLIISCLLKTYALLYIPNKKRLQFAKAMRATEDPHATLAGRTHAPRAHKLLPRRAAPRPGHARGAAAGKSSLPGLGFNRKPMLLHTSLENRCANFKSQQKAHPPCRGFGTDQKTTETTQKHPKPKSFNAGVPALASRCNIILEFSSKTKKRNVSMILNKFHRILF